MTKEEFLNRINETIDFICNGTVERNGKVFNGHPHFYLEHTKEEFDIELLRTIPDKESYDKYDLYYVLNHMFKYALNRYDSHTLAYFYNSEYLPVILKVIDDHVYIIDSSESLKEYRGMEIKKINGIDIEQIIKELDSIKCYASRDYFNIQIEGCLTSVEVLRSLPSIGNTNTLTFSDDNKELNFDNIEEFSINYNDLNYKTEVIDDTLIFTYNSCNDEEKMKSTIEKIKELDGINHYIIDIRGNGGGDSRINDYLINFLKGKDTYVLCDERVFSSARMCLASLKRNGAFVIGKPPGTPLSCFGNNLLKKDFKDMELMVRGSVSYWYYDSELKCHGFTKENFDDVLKQYPKILDIFYGGVDIEIEPTLEDILNKKDTVLEFAIDYINNKIEYKHIR